VGGKLLEKKITRIIVLDNTAFISGFNLNIVVAQDPQTEIWIPQAIYEEASRHHASQHILESAIEQGVLQIGEPSEKAYILVNDITKKTGDLKSLSNNDKQLIALAITLREQYPESAVIIMSDDYSVQNTCKKLQIPIQRYQKAGIKKQIKWEIYCPDCFMVYKPELLGEECERCGAILKRRPYKGKRPHL
jgi:UPF0271 protein